MVATELGIEVGKLQEENKALREDVSNLTGMMTNVVSLLLELDIALNDDSPVSDETRERFQSSAGVWHGYAQKKILDTTSDVIARMADPAKPHS